MSDFNMRIIDKDLMLLKLEPIRKRKKSKIKIKKKMRKE